jgi:hypothetical protein
MGFRNIQYNCTKPLILGFNALWYLNAYIHEL